MAMRADDLWAVSRQDFLDGEKREKFQTDFRLELDKACKEDHVIVRSAFIRNIVIPDAFLQQKREERIAVEAKITSEALTLTEVTKAEVAKAKQGIKQREEEVLAESDRLVAVVEREVENVKLNFSRPPIDKLDPAIISTLTNCRHLSLSTNCIEKMVPIAGLKKLEILSLGRNQIRKIYGLEEIGSNLKELWISYNQIEKLDGLAPHCTALQVLYIAHNKIKDWNELDKIKDLPALTNCVFLGNEIYDKFPNKEEGRLQVLKRLPKLTMIDNVLVTEADKNKIKD